MHPSLRISFLACTLGATALLSACGGHGPAGPPSAAAQPAAGAVLSPELQAVYDRSCKNCHAVPASGAPQAGDTRAWAPRIAQGADILVEHTFSGYKSIPPLGACMDCNEKQYRALIEFMSGASLKN
jgi:cytochrome c5